MYYCNHEHERCYAAVAVLREQLFRLDLWKCAELKMNVKFYL